MRLRFDGLSTTLGGSGLTNSATSVTFGAALTHDGGTNVPTLANSDFIPLSILDSSGKVAEIVYLTAYTAAATTGTIIRGREGTSGVSHSAGAKVVHGPTVFDFKGGLPGFEKHRLGLTLRKVGTVLSPGTWDNQIVESPAVFFDPKAGDLKMVYTGYGNGSGAQRAGIGLAKSPDGYTWTKVGSAAILAHSAGSGDPDENGCTAPLVVWDNENNRYVMFYVGLTATGYEAGTKRLCVATATTLTGTWTRQGAIITPSGSGWRQTAIWHPSVVRRDGTWYLFFNATGSDSIEKIGYATASDLLGPWTVDDTNSPVLTVGSSGAWDDAFIGDPSVRRVGDVWVMNYYGYDGAAAHDGVAVTPDSLFPLGWTKYAGNPVLTPSETYDAKYAHKPFVFEQGGELLHYYTAVDNSDNRKIALAVDSAFDNAMGAERIRDVIGATLVQGTGATVTVNDSSDTITIAATGTGGGITPGRTSAKRTAGNVTLNSSTFTNIDTGIDLTIAAASGDVLEVTLALRASASAGTYCVFDFHTIVSGSPVRSVGADATAGTTNNGFPGWSTGNVRTTLNGYQHFVGTKQYTVQSGDISSGNVTLRLRGFNNGTNAVTIDATADPYIYVAVVNLKQ